MTLMYFVDRSKIEERLLFIDGLLQEFRNTNFDSVIERLALERIIQVTIEAIIDVGNLMIDGFIMRDPGSYDDIIDILVDEKVLLQTESNPYKKIISLRKMLVRDYTEINHDDIQKSLKQQLDIIELFSSRVRRYLDEELGPVSAFSSE